MSAAALVCIVVMWLCCWRRPPESKGNTPQCNMVTAPPKMKMVTFQQPLKADSTNLVEVTTVTSSYICETFAKGEWQTSPFSAPEQPSSPKEKVAAVNGGISSVGGVGGADGSGVAEIPPAETPGLVRCRSRTVGVSGRQRRKGHSSTVLVRNAFSTPSSRRSSFNQVSYRLPCTPRPYRSISMVQRDITELYSLLPPPLEEDTDVIEHPYDELPWEMRESLQRKLCAVVEESEAETETEIAMQLYHEPI